MSAHLAREAPVVVGSARSTTVRAEATGGAPLTTLPSEVTRACGLRATSRASRPKRTIGAMSFEAYTASAGTRWWHMMKRFDARGTADALTHWARYARWFDGHAHECIFLWTREADCLHAYNMSSDSSDFVGPYARNRLAVFGEAEYVFVVSGALTRALRLVDWRACGQKEDAFARGFGRPLNPKKTAHWHAVAASLTALGFDGWISAHDAGDPRLEICVFPAARGSGAVVAGASQVFGP